MIALERINYIVVHHSLTPDGVQPSVEAIRRYHVQHNGWDDIGYHALVEQAGTTVEVLLGRPWTCQGAHAPGHNADSLGVCIVGDFDAGPIDPAHWQAAVKFVAWLARFFKVPTANVLGHREATPNRTCPGAHFDMALFRAAVNAAR